MNTKVRNGLLIVSGIAVAGATVGIIVKKSNDKQLITKIHSILDNNQGTGTLKDYVDVFSGNTFLDKVKGQIGSGQDFIKLRDEYITQYRKAIYDAGQGRAGTDEEAIKNVFKSLNDKVAIAQVAQSYLTNYKTDLLSALYDEMDEKSSDIADIFNIIQNKPNYRLV